MKTKLTFLGLLMAKAAASKNAKVMVPALESKPEFFVSTATSPLHQPAKPSAQMFTVNSVLVVKMPRLGMRAMPVSAGYYQRGTKRLFSYMHGLN